MVGGATLSVLGIVDRTTKDVDVIAQARRDDGGNWTLTPPVPLPEALQKAVALVGGTTASGPIGSTRRWGLNGGRDSLIRSFRIRSGGDTPLFGSASRGARP